MTRHVDNDRASQTREPRATRCTIRPGALFSRFLRNRDGVTAIEFAVVAAPFFALILAIMETALVFLAGQLMESAVNDAGRMVRTGQAKPPDGITQAQLKQEICDSSVILMDCAEKLQLDVRVFDDFEATSDQLNEPVLDEDGELDVEISYDPGQGTDIVVVRAFYAWPTFVPGFGLGPGDMANGDRLLMAVTAFRNEPF